MVYRLLFIVFFSAVVAGCGGTLKRGWTNFTTYYNTFYNARQYFDEGERSIRNQEVELDPASPVRIHPAPTAAGDKSFEKAIAKCALVLERHAQSKWVDDALLLMGKSHYYRGDFSTAINRFEELNKLGTDSSLAEQATLWKGRALLDLRDYNRGIAYLEPLLQPYPENWSITTKGELQALIAEHQAMLGHWKEASDYLTKAIANIEDQQLLGRSHFLYAQMLEHQGKLGEAQYAYKQVPSYFPGTEYIYWFKIKQANIARKQGNLEAALEIYERLRKNDKYVDRRAGLRLDMAQTLQEQGQTAEAEQLYQELLYGGNRSDKRSLQADAYYQMGKIYGDVYRHYSMAAAYFDTSSSLRSSDNITADSARTYMRYANLRLSIERADSLLKLGSLAPEQLDSVIERMRSDERKRLLETQPESDNRLRNQPVLSQEDDSTRSTIYGFLNHRNQNARSQAKKEFRILWGNRPLVDNWRRQEAFSRSIGFTNDEVRSAKPNAIAEGYPVALELGLEAIPRTEAERRKLQKERLYDQYQLANLLHLNMNRPDSAKIFYHNVIRSPLDEEIRPKAMYALHELFQAEALSDSVRYWKEQLMDAYPESRYARLVAPKEEPLLAEEATDSSRMLKKYQHIRSSGDWSKGARLRSLAKEHQASGLAPDIHYEAVEAYIQKAKGYQQITRMRYRDATDSIRLSDEETHLLEWTFMPADAYSSTHWDNVRTVLAEHDSLFEDSSYQSKVAALQAEVGKESSDTSSALPTCSDKGISLSIQPDMQSFLGTVNWPDNLKENRLAGEIVYSFVVSEEGAVRSYNLESPSTSLGIEDALEQAFETSLTFGPLEISDNERMLRCRVIFPLTL
jgi:tetratricopeptide (TPR) repeat protein